MYIQYDPVHGVLVDEGGLPVSRDAVRLLLPQIRSYLRLTDRKLEKIEDQIMRERYPRMVQEGDQ